MRSLLIWLLVGLVFAAPSSLAAPPVLPKPPKVKLAPLVDPKEPVQLPTPAAATQLAAVDIATIPVADQPFQRYFFTYDRSKEFKGAFNYLLNTCLSHSSVLYKPTATADGWLLRVDLRRMWPRTEDYDALFPEFEKLAQIDPYFHTTGEIVVKRTDRVLVDVPVYRGSDGKTYTQKWQDKEVEEKKRGSEHSLHLLGAAKQEASILALAAATGSSAPILRADWFMYIIATQNPAENGHYYTFRRTKPSNESKSAETLWLADQGITYDTIQNIRSDQRVAKWRSNVTGKPRAIEFFFSSATRPAVGPAAAFITRDWFTGKIDAKRHPLKNLIDYKHDGVEAMGFLPNGMITFALFDGKGGLVDVADDKLVVDRTVPAPHPTGLQAPISCIRCHGPVDLWQPVSNDILALSKGKLGLNIFDDVGSKTDPDDTLDRLAGLYSGEAEETLQIVRNTHAKAVFITTDGMDIPSVADVISEVYNRYRYEPVTPKQACLELGWHVAEADALAFFDKMLPKLPPNRLGVHPESVTIGALRAWTTTNRLHVNRDDWEQEYADAMLRVVTESVRTQAQKAQEPKK